MPDALLMPRDTSSTSVPVSGHSLSVRDDLCYRRIGEDFVFLCLRTDRYFLLRGSAGERFERFLVGDSDPADIAWLVERQLVSHTADHAGFISRPFPLPRSSLLDTPMPRAGLGLTSRVLAAQFRARHELRERSLGAIVNDLDRFGDATAVAESDIGLALASAFLRARRYVSAIDQCLVRGLAMKRMAMRQKLDARLVIGVTMPFSAHCWVQVGEIILTDPLDMVRPFQPILAV